VWREDADHLGRHCAGVEYAPNYGGIGAEAALPCLVCQDQHVVVVSGLALVALKPATQGGLHTQQLQKVCRHQGAGNVFGAALVGEIEPEGFPNARNANERCRMFTPLLELGFGNVGNKGLVRRVGP